MYVDEYLVTRTGGRTSAGTIDDLAGTEISVRRSSSYYQTLVNLQAAGADPANPDRTGNSEHRSTTGRRRQRGEYQATLSDSHLWHALSSYYDSLTTLPCAGEGPPDRGDDAARGYRTQDQGGRIPARPALFSRLRQRMNSRTIFPGLIERGRLRMITRNNAMTYFIHRGLQVGFEYELMKKFASEHGLRLEVVIPKSHAELLSYLNDGKGDVVAAAMTITPERQVEADFTEPYNEVEEVVVVREDDDSIMTIRDLAGRTFHVRGSSSFYPTLKALKDSVEDLRIVKLPDDIETEEIMVGVESGLYDLTLVDSNLFDVERTYGLRLRAAFSVKSTTLGWGVRKGNPALLGSLNEYIRREKGGLYFNMMKKRYFENPRRIARAKDSTRVGISGQLSPFDDLVKEYAQRYGQDWRLVTAQMYQESKFDPDAVSWVGAKGLMQVMPRTGLQLGFEDLEDPEQGIHAGTKYMHQLIDRFDHEIPMQSRIRFALASYNVGYGHLLDARRLAREKGWDPNLWFGHVEQAMRLLSQPAYYERARFGYCRGGQPVYYVEKIQSLYDAYVEVLDTAQ